MPAGAIAMYELEWQTYRDQRERLLATAAGDFVVIRGAEILGTYPTLLEGYSAATAAYGDAGRSDCDVRVRMADLPRPA